MANTIVIKNRKQADAVAPTLIQGEVATNLSDKKLFVGEGASNVVFADMDYYADIVTNTHTHSNSGILDGTTASYTTTDETKIDYITVTGAVDLDTINTRVANLDAAVVLKGTWDASSGVFPTSTKSGESWIASVTGTVDSVEFKTNDRVVAVTDDASTTSYTDWHKLDYTDEVLSVAGQTGTVTLSSSDVGLGSVVNIDTTDADNIADGSVNAIITLTQETNFETAYTHSQAAHAPSDANNYSHPTGDGNSHLPVNGTGNDGKIVAATETAGVYELINAPSGTTNIAEGTNTSTTVEITSSTGTSATLTAASGITAGVLTSAKFDEIVTNSLKNTNVTTDLTKNSTVSDVTIESSDGTNVNIGVATTSVAGVMSKAIFDEHTVNNSKDTNTATDLSFGTNNGTTLELNSSDGADVTLPAAATGVAGLLSGSDKDKLDGVATSANNYSLPTSVLHDTETIDGGTF